jgi:hypothetical protein
MKKLALLSIFLALPLLAHAGALAGQAGSSGITLSWTASTTAGGTVNVYRCIGASCTTFTQLTTGITAAGPYTDSSVTAGAYSYYVTSVVNGAESIASNTATISVLPQPPTGLVAKNP